MSSRHYAVLMLLFVSSWTTTVSLSGMYLSIVSLEKRYKYRFIVSQILYTRYRSLCFDTICLCGSLAQCALGLKRLSAGPGFNPQTRQNKLFQDLVFALLFCQLVSFLDIEYRTIGVGKLNHLKHTVKCIYVLNF